ncbi:AMP-binding protein [Kocuria atrinae]|uniref:AMP-binding protein n=1 Tax=Kocuria atrinae TaxID=592377 RepID=UPI0002DDB473|nr:AMP-binding protein [Kocuria atrinae]
MYANAQPLSPLRFIERSAEVFPQREAIVYGNQSWTYQEFERDVRRFATALLPHLPSASASNDDAAASGDVAGTGDRAVRQLPMKTRHKVRLRAGSTWVRNS